MYLDKYNIKPIAGKTRLGSKHSAESKALMSKLRKEYFHFLNKTHGESQVKELRLRMQGGGNHIFGKPVTDENKELISKLFSKKVYVYDANTLKLVESFDKHKDLALAFNMSSKTIIKYKDSGLAFRDKYIISSQNL